MSERRPAATTSPSPATQSFPELLEVAVGAERELRAAQRNSKKPLEEVLAHNTPEMQEFDTRLTARIGDVGLFSAFIDEFPTDSHQEQEQLATALEDLKGDVGVSGLAVRAVARATKRIAGRMDPTDEAALGEFGKASDIVLGVLGHVDESSTDENRPSKKERQRYAARPSLFDDTERQSMVADFELEEGELQADVEEIAGLFTTIYKPARDRLDQAETFKKAFPLTDPENAVVLAEIKATNKYARLLTDVFLGLNSDNDRRQLDRALLGVLVADAKAEEAVGRPADVEGIRRTYNQMMTGIKLEAASMRALEQFGLDVRSSTVEEDVEKGADAYCKRENDGVEVPIDFKSDRSFGKQAVRTQENEATPGIKIKHNKQTGDVLVVNSQRLGGHVDRVTGATRPIRGWELDDPRGFAVAVNQAVSRW